MATAKKTTTKPPAPPATATQAPPPAEATTAPITHSSAITDLGHARALPACSGWAHEYEQPAYAEGTIEKFYDTDGATVMRIVVCDGVPAKAPVQINQED